MSTVRRAGEHGENCVEDSPEGLAGLGVNVFPGGTNLDKHTAFSIWDPMERLCSSLGFGGQSRVKRARDRLGG